MGFPFIWSDFTYIKEKQEIIYGPCVFDLKKKTVTKNYDIPDKNTFIENRTIKDKKMKTTIQQLEDKFLVTFDGELDTAAAAEVEQTLQPLYNSNGLDVIIDCEKLEYIASSGLRILISILKGAKAGGSKVVLKQLNEDILSVFKMTGFISLFEIE